MKLDKKNSWKEQYGRVIEELRKSRREVKELKLQLKEAARVTRRQTLEKANEPEPFDHLVNGRLKNGQGSNCVKLSSFTHVRRMLHILLGMDHQGTLQ